MQKASLTKGHYMRQSPPVGFQSLVLSIAEPCSPMMTDTMANVPPLAEVAKLLAEVASRLSSRPTGFERLTYLFHTLCATRWMDAVSHQFRDPVEGPIEYSMGFVFAPIERQILDDLSAAIEEAKIEEDSTTGLALGERAQLVLKALLNKKAFDSDHRQTTEDIAVVAAGKTADANQFKEVVADLRRRRYVDTKKGRRGGCWLTTSGRQRAEKL